MKKYAKDKFDDLPKDLERVGAHRGPKQKGRAWIAFAWCAFATVLLIGVGLTGKSLIDQNVSFTGAWAPVTVTNTISEAPVTTTWEPEISTSAETVDLDQGEVIPVFDGVTPVQVQNASGVDGSGAAVTALLATAGFNMAEPVTAAVISEASVVYYTDASLEAAALGLAENIPGATTALSTDYPVGQLTFVIGSSYVAG